MTCLSVVQTVCRRIGLQVPNAAVSSSDPQITQIVAIANEEGQDLADRIAWQALNADATFVTLAAESQGALSTLAPNLKFIVNDTIWNRTQQRALFGPAAPRHWQAQLAQAFFVPWGQYRIRGDTLRILPIPTAGETCAFEYAGRNWVRDSGASITRDGYTADDDVSLLDEQLIQLGTLWRWKKHKGFEYAEDFNAYERRVADAMARDGTKAVLDMGGVYYSNRVGTMGYSVIGGTVSGTDWDDGGTDWDGGVTIWD